MYLTLDEAIKKLGYTQVQLMQCIAVGHICPVTLTAKGEFPVENAREKADRLTERHFILREMPEGSKQKFYPCTPEEYSHNVEVQGIIEHYEEELPDWYFRESDCDPATMGHTVKPKVNAIDQRILIIIKAMKNLGVDHQKVPATGGTIKLIREWCEENYPELFPLGLKGHSKNVFDKAWSSGKGIHWDMTLNKNKSS